MINVLDISTCTSETEELFFFFWSKEIQQKNINILTLYQVSHLLSYFAVGLENHNGSRGFGAY
jgi:hypothetical protein